MKMNRSMVVFADAHVGFSCMVWLLSEYTDDLICVFTTTENKIYDICLSSGINVFVYKSDDEAISLISGFGLDVDFGFLIWWPKIISKKLIELSKNGYINTHPSILPYNRGKHYNFWSIVENSPFGVTLHLVDEGIDSGPVIAQRPIAYTWEDNGGTLYEKAIQEMIKIFIDFYPKIRTLDFTAVPQDLSILLNLLRARTFYEKPACFFVENDIRYEVRVEIKKVDEEGVV